MTIDKSLIDSFAKSTARAAYGASLFRGKNDKIGADKAAVDEMRKILNNINMKGKTIGIAIKDRSAILPAGHTANAAYWSITSPKSDAPDQSMSCGRARYVEYTE